jgi:hypothetical protein
MLCFLSGFDHHAVPPGVHDPRVVEEGKEAEADLDRRGVGPHQPAHGGREGHDGGGGVGQHCGVGRGGRAHAHPRHGAQFLAHTEANLRRLVELPSRTAPLTCRARPSAPSDLDA